MAPAAFLLAMLRATAILEERTLVDAAPLRELIVVRARYAPGELRDAALPEALPATPRPEVRDASSGARLPLRREGARWVVTLPPIAHGEARVIARVERPAPTPRAFALRWPPPGDPSARRVVTLPRAWSADEPDGWSCPGLDPDERTCVSRGASTAFRVRVPASPSPRGAWALALPLATASLLAAPRLGRDRIESLLAAVGGAGVGVAAALSLVGSRATSWAVALALCVPLGALLGAVATRARSSRALGSLALAAIPLAVALGASPAAVLGACALAACACLAPLSSPWSSR